ncbi:hypothetical protein LB505_001012 [Fusarium chuoi]|nr:hypothetical protein LB505_001012 [Fusarium chuoi]
MDSFFPGLSIPSQSELNDLDYSLLQAIAGQHVTAEDYGLGEKQPIDLSQTVTDRDIEHYENIRDLFWWYCKMDVYQSMLADMDRMIILSFYWAGLQTFLPKIFQENEKQVSPGDLLLELVAVHHHHSLVSFLQMESSTYQEGLHHPVRHRHRVTLQMITMQTRVTRLRLRSGSLSSWASKHMKAA